MVELAIAPPDWRAVAYHSVVPMLSGSSSFRDRRWHHRRDRDAARDLPSFQPHQRSHSRRRRRLATARRPLLKPRGGRGARVRRAGQHGDGRDGRLDVPRGASRGGRNRNRVSHAAAAVRRCRGVCVHGVAAGVGIFLVGGRHDGGAGHHAGLRAVHDPAVGAADHHDDTGGAGGGGGRGRHAGAGRQPNRFEPRAAGSDGGLADPHRTARGDGRRFRRARPDARGPARRDDPGAVAERESTWRKWRASTCRLSRHDRPCPAPADRRSRPRQSGSARRGRRSPPHCWKTTSS